MYLCIKANLTFSKMQSELQLRELNQFLERNANSFPRYMEIVVHPKNGSVKNGICSNDASENCVSLIRILENCPKDATLSINGNPSSPLKFDSVRVENVITLLDDYLNKTCERIRHFPDLMTTPMNGKNNTILGLLLLLSGGYASDEDASDDDCYFDSYGQLTREEAEQSGLL